MFTVLGVYEGKIMSVATGKIEDVHWQDRLLRCCRGPARVGCKFTSFLSDFADIMTFGVDGQVRNQGLGGITLKVSSLGQNV